MHPIERLRFVAGAGDADPAALAIEAADALYDLARDPRALVMASVRLVAAHPDCGPLWWAVSRLLVATEPREAAAAVVDCVVGDATAGELAAAFPSASVVVCEPTPLVAGALAERPDLVARFLGEPRRVAAAVRALASGCEASGWTTDEASEALEGATCCCIGALAAGPGGAVVRPAAARLAAAARAARVPVWLVAPVGSVLPDGLFGALVRRCATARLLETEAIGADAIDLVVGPDGPVSRRDGLARAAGPFAAELTR